MPKKAELFHMAQGFAYSNLKSVDMNHHKRINTVHLADLYTTDAIPEDTYPLKFKTIQLEQ